MEQNEKSTSSTLPWKEILSFVGVILGAYIGYLGIRSQIEIPIQATQTAEAKISPSPSIIAPTALETPSPITTSQTVTAVSVSETGEKGFENNCISINSWTPYKGEVNPTENDCWKLLDFGFYVQNSTLFIAVDNNKSDFQHGIFTSIPLKARIDLKIQVEKVETLYDQPAKITFGIIQADPINPEAGKYFTFQYNGISQPDFLDIKLGDSPDFGQFIADKLYIGTSQNHLTMLLDGIYLQVFLDGNQVADRITIPFEKRNFWIGFSVPAGSKLDVKIFEFAIQEN